MEQTGPADYYDVTCENGRIVLTPLHPGGASAVWSRLMELAARLGIQRPVFTELVWLLRSRLQLCDQSHDHRCGRHPLKWCLMHDA